jgi:phage terminase large subunit
MSATLEIRPRKQFRGFIESNKRWSCLVVHRRGGKTYSSLQKLLLRALSHKRDGPPPRYAYIAPTQSQAKDIAWAYLKSFTWQIPGAVINESDLKITFSDGMTIRLYSGENYERMRGLYFDGVIIDEPEDISPMAWASVIRPCLSDYGGWAIWIGTIKGKKGHWTRYLKALKNPEWYCMLLKAEDSGILSDEELSSIKNDPDITPEIYEQEYQCNPNIGRPGAIYAKEVFEAEASGRVVEFEPDGNHLVHTCWDLGSPENTSVVYFQRIGMRLLIIDHDKGLRLTTAQRVAHMLAKGYAFGNHCLPHDAASTTATGISFVQELVAAGLPNVFVIPRTTDIERRINRMWGMFPNIYFRESKTTYLLESLEAYRRKDEVSSASIKSEILHDWASHDADAFGYIAEAESAGMISDGSGRPARAVVARVSRERQKMDDDDEDGGRHKVRVKFW